jgi:hypothetical protein
MRPHEKLYHPRPSDWLHQRGQCIRMSAVPDPTISKLPIDLSNREFYRAGMPFEALEEIHRGSSLCWHPPTEGSRHRNAGGRRHRPPPHPLSRSPLEESPHAFSLQDLPRLGCTSTRRHRHDERTGIPGGSGPEALENRRYPEKASTAQRVSVPFWPGRRGRHESAHGRLQPGLHRLAAQSLARLPLLHRRRRSP